MKIFDYLNPHQINNAFQTLISATQSKKALEIQKKQIQQELDRNFSNYLANEIYSKEQLRNSETREAASRESWPDLWVQLDGIEINLAQNSETLEIARIEIDRMKLLVDYFRTVEV